MLVTAIIRWKCTNENKWCLYKMSLLILLVNYHIT